DSCLFSNAHFRAGTEMAPTYINRTATKSAGSTTAVLNSVADLKVGDHIMQSYAVDNSDATLSSPYDMGVPIGATISSIDPDTNTISIAPLRFYTGTTGTIRIKQPAYMIDMRGFGEGNRIWGLSFHNIVMSGVNSEASGIRMPPHTYVAQMSHIRSFYLNGYAIDHLYGDSCTDFVLSNFQLVLGQSTVEPISRKGLGVGMSN